MFEQDIQLARLLLEKCQASQQRRDDLQAELTEREQELEHKEAIRREREGYADVMAKAAALLERPDLEVAVPETAGLEEQVGQLREQTGAANQELSQLEELLAELEARAPQIVDSARSELGIPAGEHAVEEEEQVEAEEPAESEAVEAESAEVVPEDEHEEEEEPKAEDTASVEEDPEPESADTEELEEAAQEDEPAEAEPEEDDEHIKVDDEPEEEAPAIDEDDEDTPEVDAYDAGNLLKRFNLHALKTKEAFTYGRGAAYLIDATSVLERVPNYDLAIRGDESSTVRDELLRDFDQLSRELSGTFYIVFDSWYHPLVSVGNRVGAIYTTGELEGTRDGARRRAADLVKELTGKHHTICIVTSDEELSGQFDTDDIFIISLAEFFNF